MVGNNGAFIAQAAATAAVAGRHAEALSLWHRAAALEPENPLYGLSAAMAEIGERAGRQQRLTHVLQRLRDLQSRFADHSPIYVAQISVLREMAQAAEADRVSASACQRFPGDLKLMLARTAVLEDSGDFARALRDVAAFRGRAAPSASLEAAYIHALSCAGYGSDAEEASKVALARYRGDRRIWLEYARTASRKGDWHQTVQRLEKAQKLRPHDGGIATQLQTARLQLAVPHAVAASTEIGLFDRFESLGGSGMGCEFGMVQRRLGSDSVGLLRWARTNPAELQAAIAAGFEGVGEEAHTELRAARPNVDREEYVTRDRRYLLESHTFVRTIDAPADRMFEQTCRRLRFLRIKLLQDLENADKIFVYRCERPIADAAAVALHVALTKYGDNALLCVMRAESPGQASMVRALGRGLFIGYVRHFALDRGCATGSDMAGWIAVCTQADALWRTTRQTEAGDAGDVSL